MKRLLPLMMLMMISMTAIASTSLNSWTNVFNNEPESQEFVDEMPEMTVEDFLALTPKKYEEMTGQALGVAGALKLKAAQKLLKKQMNNNPDGDLEKTVYIVLAIVGLGFVGIGILDDWDGSDWIIALVLSLLCWLPGVIYSLVKMKNYY